MTSQPTANMQTILCELMLLDISVNVSKLKYCSTADYYFVQNVVNRLFLLGHGLWSSCLHMLFVLPCLMSHCFGNMAFIFLINVSNTDQRLSLIPDSTPQLITPTHLSIWSTNKHLYQQKHFSSLIGSGFCSLQQSSRKASYLIIWQHVCKLTSKFSENLSYRFSEIIHIKYILLIWSDQLWLACFLEHHSNNHCKSIMLKYSQRYCHYFWRIEVSQTPHKVEDSSAMLEIRRMREDWGSLAKAGPTIRGDAIRQIVFWTG